MSARKRVIVEVRYGASTSRKAILDPGGVLRVGRFDTTDFAITHDEQMSGVHFELSWDGAACALSDLESATGTFLSGERVTRAKVSNGDWIRAGATDFLVFFEAHSPPPKERPGALPLAVREQALRELQALMASGPLYVVVDAARRERPLFMLRESVEEYRSLYDGVTAETMALAAPYLVRLREDSGLLARLVLEGWGDAWGVYFTSKRSPRDVRAHLRKLLMVAREDAGDVVYFRFYDPRVLPVVLPTCNARQQAEIFGEIDAFYCEDDAGGVLRLTPEQAPASR